jgi:hypothetical protein
MYGDPVSKEKNDRMVKWGLFGSGNQSELGGQKESEEYFIHTYKNRIMKHLIHTNKKI